MEQSGGGEHGTKHGGVMGCGSWAHGRVCGLGGPQGGRTRDAQGRRCAIWQYGKNNYDPRGACGSNKRGLRVIAYKNVCIVHERQRDVNLDHGYDKDVRRLGLHHDSQLILGWVRPMIEWSHPRMPHPLL